MELANNLEARAIADSNADHKAWLEARLGGVTASDVAQFEEGYDVDKLVHKKLHSTFKGNKWTDWGLEREPYLVGWTGYLPNSKTHHAEDNRYFLATPDGFKFDEGNILHLTQAKTTSKGWDTIPPNYIRQCQWEMYVMGAETNLLVWETHQNFIPTELEPQTLLLDRDDKMIDRLVFEAHIVLQRLNKMRKEQNV